ncbi:hypothetical protein ACM66B_001185 [Microbotryomycetes sp. NB124-2]
MAGCDDFEIMTATVYSPQDGLALVDRHLERLEDAHAALAQLLPHSWCANSTFPDRDSIEKAMERACEDAGLDKRLRIRVTIGPDVLPFAQAFSFSPMPTYPVRLVLDDRPTDYSDPFMRYKTTHRTAYDQARERLGATLHPSDDNDSPPFDVILFNDKNQVTETTIANIAFKFTIHDDVWYTPSSECGLLQGVRRQEMIDKAELQTAIIPLDKVKRAAAAGTLLIICFNGVRGVFPARL